MDLCVPWRCISEVGAVNVINIGEINIPASSAPKLYEYRQGTGEQVVVYL